MGQPAHLSVDGRVVDGPAIQRLREAGAETIICWGVNTGQAWERLTAWGIDGITSDNRLLLREIVEGRRAKGEG
jgi:glycerophosphoryl diester phosphodiesterase